MPCLRLRIIKSRERILGYGLSVGCEISLRERRINTTTFSSTPIRAFQYTLKLRLPLWIASYFRLWQSNSSRRAIQNAFSLVYGLKLPSEIYAQHMFATRMKSGGLELPQVHLLIKNRLTQYMGPASGYAAVLRAIDADILGLIKENSKLLTFKSMDKGTEEVRDFQTTGVVAFARGTPFVYPRPGKLVIQGQRVAVDAAQIETRVNEIRAL